MLFEILLLIIVIILLIASVLSYTWSKNPALTLSILNNLADNHDQILDAVDSNLVDLHNLIVLNHEDILLETLEIVNSNQFIPLDSPDYLNIDDAWRPIWLKFMTEFTKLADQSANLKRIISLFPNVVNCYISVIEPGKVIVDRFSNPWIKRYLYGLQVTDNDLGMKIGDQELVWTEQKGYLWSKLDDYYVWNKTTKNRIIIVIDVCEEMTPKIINWLHKRNRLVMDARNKIA